MLELRDVHTYYGNIHALKGISFTVDDGEVVTLIGANGAGKSTTLRTIQGLNRPRSGTVVLNGVALEKMPTDQIVAQGVSQAPEGRQIFPRMTVLENLEMGAFPKSARGRLKETLEHVIELFPILARRKDQPAGTLSGGEQQMLAIGRALMSRPTLLLVDELSLGLAPLVTKSIYRTLSELGADITLLLVEQNVEQALNFSQRAYILEGGRMTRSGRSADLIQDADIRRAYLGM